eukprot:1041363_1
MQHGYIDVCAKNGFRCMKDHHLHKKSLILRVYTFWMEPMQQSACIILMFTYVVMNLAPHRHACTIVACSPILNILCVGHACDLLLMEISHALQGNLNGFLGFLASIICIDKRCLSTKRKYVIGYNEQ